MAKNLEMFGYLSVVSNKTTLEDLKQGLNGVVDSISNSLIVEEIFLILNLIFENENILVFFLRV